MWISRTLFAELMQKRYDAEGQAKVLELQVLSQKNTLDWMMLRLTQSENERAQLIHNYTGVKITVPSIEPEAKPLSMQDLLSAAPSFDDVGDDEAKAQGLDWDATGQLTRHGKLVQG